METILDAIAADPNVSEAFKDGMKAGEVKHTPGPWQYLGSPNRDYFEPTILSPDGKVIAAFRSYDFPDAAEHNARLGAGAPELLEALRLVLGIFDFGEEFPDDHPIIAARAAIAKATGAQE